MAECSLRRDPGRTSRTYRHGMVARCGGPQAHSRLLPGREPRRRAHLALPPRLLRRSRTGTMVPARGVRVSNVHPLPIAEKPRRAEPDTPAPAYAELAVTTSFSFLRGGS